MSDSLHVISPGDLSHEARTAILQRAAEIKASDAPPVGKGLRVGALYFNPSLRTRVSFEQAVRLVGGTCQTLDATRDTWGLELDPEAVMDGAAVENIAEAARVLGRFFHLLGVRSFRGDGPWAEERTEPVLRKVAAYAGVPLISLEGTTHHPCQALADHLTLREHFGETKGLPVVLSWAWHPRALPTAVPQSFLLEAALAGCDVTVAHPVGFDLDAGVMAEAKAAAQAQGGGVRVVHDQAEAYRGAKVVYVKSWGRLDRDKGPTDPSLRSWICDEAAMRGTDDGRVMHCLPVRRNVVIAGEVLDGPRSLVIDQAENRLWAQAGLVEWVARQAGVLP